MCWCLGRKKDRSQKSRKSTRNTGTGEKFTTGKTQDPSTVPEAAMDKSGKDGKPVTGEVLNVMKNFVDETCKKGIDGLIKDYMKHPPKICQSHEAYSANQPKNRYNNIPCYDSTRIVLKYRVPPESDYIHANRIKSKIVELKNEFICTQGPVDITINDFWRMIWQEKPKYIVMLCRTFENNKAKCAQYWPAKVGATATYGSIKVTNEGDGGKGKEIVFDIEKFTVRAEGQEIVVKQIRWLDWPDFGIPRTGLGMLRVLRKIDQDSGKAIVHCSAGIGRSGTLLAAEILMKAITSGKNVKVVDVLKELREQRFGLIQTTGQYCYLHFSLVQYIYRKIENYPGTQETSSRIKAFLKAYVDYSNDEEKKERAQGGRTETGVKR